MAQNIPDYTAMLGIQLAIRRITSSSAPLEHHVGSFAFTMVKHVFNDPKWVITGELTDRHSGKRPDITIEQASGDKLKVHMVYELKRKEGGRMEDAVDQVIRAVVETIDEQGQESRAFDVFLVVQRGLDIVFFEYHNNVSDLEEEGIPNFDGCISLTQAYEGYTQVMGPPDNLKQLYYDTNRLRVDTQTRQMARKYDVPCVFNLIEHKKEINLLFHHMATQEPRGTL